MNILIDITQKQITTERLTLRKPKLSDLDDFYEYAKVDGVGQMCGWLPHKNKEESLEVLKMFIKEHNVFAIIFNNRMVGTIGYNNYKEYEFPELKDKICTEIGYCLSKDYWGQGIMPEALNAILKFSFEVLEMDVVLSGHFVWNNQSKRVQEKCNMKYVKTVDYKTRYGTFEKCDMTMITKEEFEDELRNGISDK